MEATILISKRYNILVHIYVSPVTSPIVLLSNSLRKTSDQRHFNTQSNRTALNFDKSKAWKTHHRKKKKFQLFGLVAKADGLTESLRSLQGTQLRRGAFGMSQPSLDITQLKFSWASTKP